MLTTSVKALLCFFLSSLMLSDYATAAAPKRIVSLDLCSDWVLVEYIDRSKVLALSPLFQKYPADLRAGDTENDEWPTHDGSLEKLLSLKPDLVLVGEHNAWLLRERLKRLGFRVIVLSHPKNMSQVIDYENQFFNAVGSKRRSLLMLPKVKHLLLHKALMLGNNGIGTGQGTFENDVLKYAGWGNYLDEEGYIRLQLEELVIRKPDVILSATSDDAALASQFAQHTAIRKLMQRNEWIDSSSWRWRCPGPWTWELVSELALELKKFNE